MNNSMDREEREILDRFERGELRSTANAEREIQAAIEAARRGEVVELGSPADALAELNRDD